MIWKKAQVKYLMTGLILLLSGCGKSPEVSVREGITFADSVVSDREYESEMMDDDEMDPNEVIKKDGIASSMETEIRSEISTLKINAQINHLSAGSKAFTGTVKLHSINVDHMLELFFGDSSHAQRIDREIYEQDESANENVNSTETGETAESVDYHFLPDNESVGLWVLMNEDHSKETARFSIDHKGSLSYINLELEEAYPSKYPGNTPSNTTMREEPPVETDAPSTSLTREDAIRQLQNIINRMEGPEIEVVRCLAFQDINGKGYYQLEFVPIFQGVPLSNDIPSMMDTIFGRAVMTEEGLMELVGNFMIKYEDLRESGELLTDDEIVEALTAYINNGRIIATPDVPVCKINLEYITKYDEEEIRVIPVWRLYFDEEKVGNIDVTEYSTGGIGINAIDGTLEFTY